MNKNIKQNAARETGHDEYLMRGATAIIGGQQWQSVVIRRGKRIVCGTETDGGCQTGPRLDVACEWPQDGVDHEALAEFAATAPAKRTNHDARD